MILKFINNKKIPSQTCNTVKSQFYTCESKNKTRGVVIASSNCGIVLGWREIYGAESCTQVALFYLNITNLFNGNIEKKLITNQYELILINI